MNYANPIQRQELITGLRALADFLESNPQVPAPTYTDMLVFPLRATFGENQREIDIIASRIGSGPRLHLVPATITRPRVGSAPWNIAQWPFP